MESIKDIFNSDNSFTELKYKNLSFLSMKVRRSSLSKNDKSPNIKSSFNNFPLTRQSSIKDLSKKSKAEETKNKLVIDEKWLLVDQSFEMFLELAKIVKIDKEDLINKIKNLIKIIAPSIAIHKEDISKDTLIDETTALDIFLCEILFYFNKAISSKEEILKKYKYSAPFVKVIRALIKRGGLRKLLAPLFIGGDSERLELLKILKIDYFQKCINDDDFFLESLLKILNLNENDLYTLDLNYISLPFKENERLFTYAQFITKVLQSESFLQAMVITMNFQAKGRAYSKEDIRKSMTEIYEYLLHPVVFPNYEKSKLYAVTCINLKLYLSSFVVNNIEKILKEISLELKNFNEIEKIDALKEMVLSDVNIGFEFAVLILTILHESSHILRRRLIEPKVYINTEEIEKDSLDHKINYPSGEATNNVIVIECSNINMHKKISEGGHILEYLLFGNNFNDLLIEEIRFLFNLENWNKSLKNFREDFTNIRKLMDHECLKSRQLMNKFNVGSFSRFCGNKRNKSCC